MPRLIDFDPQWIDTADRKGLGLKLKCPAGHCDGWLWVLFANPLDGGPAWEGDCFALMFDFYEATRDEQRDGPVRDRPCGKARWNRTGDVFETLSLSPSVNAHQCGHFTVTNGCW